MLSRVSTIAFYLLVIGAPMGAYGVTVNDIASILAQLETNIPQVMRLIVALSYVFGVWFVLMAVYQLKKYGQMRAMMAVQASIAKPTIVLLIGIGCLYFPKIIDISVATLWVNGSDSVLLYPEDTGNWDAVVNPVIGIVRLFGYIAFLKGWIMLAKLGKEQAQPGIAGKALMHMLGGILAINIVGTIKIVQATLGV